MLLFRVCLLLSLLCCSRGFSQQEISKKELIAKKVNDYFFLEREIIHAHFDKHIFLSGEDIWLKGYILNRRTGLPSVTSTNIYACLMDSSGKIIQRQLLYSSDGNFAGKFSLGSQFQSGKYYMQFYTNWMNNFAEDESSVYELQIINTDNTGNISLNPQYEDIDIKINAEGGIILHGVNNIIGFSILDCGGKSTLATDAEIVDETGEVLKYISVDKSGYGKFNLVPQAGITYKLTAVINGVQHEQALPPTHANGIILQCDSYTNTNTTSISIKTNPASQNLYANKLFYLLIHKDQKAHAATFSYSNTSQEYQAILQNDSLIPGVNTIRLLDSNLRQIAERIIYIYPKKNTPLNLESISTENNYTKEYAGKIPWKNTNLSISVLPEETISINNHMDIMAGVSLYPYIITDNKIAAADLLNNPSESNRYILDLYLLNQKSKYKWVNIMSNTPKANYTFDRGLTLKAKLPSGVKASKKNYVKIYSMTNLIDETVPLNDKNEFELSNIVISESAELSFELLKEQKKEKDLEILPQILNVDKSFNYKYKPIALNCITTKQSEITELVKFKPTATLLDEVMITGKKKPELKYGKVFGNYQLRAYKITDTDSRSFPSVLDLIRYHGFEVKYRLDSIIIHGRIITTFVQDRKNGEIMRNTPEVYIDDMRQLTYDQLKQIRTEDIDEFYINPHAVVPTMQNKFGIIKIYLKKNFSNRLSNETNKVYTVKEGFQIPPAFLNVDYTSLMDNQGFGNFGLIDWLPYIKTDKNGEFSFEIKKQYSGKVKLIIEGVAPNGELIYEIRTVEL